MVELAVAAAVSAMVIDWLSVLRRWDRLEEFAKSTVMVGLIGWALAADSIDTGPRAALVVALAFGLLGDVLLLPRLDRFVPGLASFLMAHLAYLVAFVATGVDPLLMVLGAFVATTLVVVVGRPIIAGAAWRDRSLGLAVVAYVVVLSAMWAVAFGVTTAAVIAGATLLVASDAILGWNRFVSPVPRARLATHVPYHVGQALIVLGLVST